MSSPQSSAHAAPPCPGRRVLQLHVLWLAVRTMLAAAIAWALIAALAGSVLGPRAVLGALFEVLFVILADPDGGYQRAFYHEARGDQLLNPFDPRAARWNLFAELVEPADADHGAPVLFKCGSIRR